MPDDFDEPSDPVPLREEDFVTSGDVPERLRRDFGTRHSASAVLISGGLFLATCLTTLLAGVQFGDMRPGQPITNLLINGASYAGPLMLILLCHEMGHYLQARRYGIPATLPIFIPLPPCVGLFGTMGAVIVQAAGQANRKALFDIAISGPLAGLVVALPVAWWGMKQSTVIQALPGQGGHFGDPLILQWMSWMVHGPLPANHDVLLNPLLFAGWVGIFLTGLNLMPIGQLDGGHIVYTLVGRFARFIGWGLIAVAIFDFAYSRYPAFILMIGLIVLLGVRHPPTADDRVPLGWGRVLLGWLSMGLLVLCFTPRPLPVEMLGGKPAAPPAPQRRQPLPPRDPDEPVIEVRAGNVDAATAS